MGLVVDHRDDCNHHDTDAHREVELLPPASAADSFLRRRNGVRFGLRHSIGHATVIDARKDAPADSRKAYNFLTAARTLAYQLARVTRSRVARCLALIAYAIGAHVQPVLVLHAALLPINAWRLWQCVRPRRIDNSARVIL